MGIDQQLFFDRSGVGIKNTLAAKIPGKRNFFDSAVHASFLECFKGRGVGVGHPRFGVAFGKGPASATARPDQQEFNALPAHPVANGGDLFAFAQFAEVREANKFC
jgi:hypothetical protein